MVEIRYFAAMADAVGTASEHLAVPADATIADLRRILVTTHGSRLAPMLKVCAFLVGDELTRDDAARLTPRVDVLPPFAGG
ncbi:MoaD/ThiS family protein [Nocardia sp. NEAU-G5]|uniref:MoaD/ThiS family protein n=1 Tax=Nocardia albiluteola TaxID=2842303 RepID=A0ABS6BBF8_9NOCA|nr:MoaD/ThiS family protein [Nocardia albiluteola]MBU3067610.1 MoaD/ThiS family protein [Nocardia albiluteola]